MNTLVVYDSQFGNTERIAQTLAETLRAFGSVRVARVDPAHLVELQGVDLLILGSPTQGFRPTLAIQSFLAKVSDEQLRGLAVACFDTRFRGFLMKRSAAPYMVKQMRRIGVEPLVQPESFFVTGKEGPLVAGEVERAARWALGVCQYFNTTEAFQSYLIWRYVCHNKISILELYFSAYPIGTNPLVSLIPSPSGVVGCGRV